jgi:alkylation response protein AidB-like acyl-CoA dehydrogenase
MTLDTTLLDAARRIAPVIRAYREQAEQERRLPTPVVEAMAEAGLLRMMTPRSLGGLEVDPLTCARVIEAVAQMDSSAGWALTNPLLYAFNCARLPDAGAEAILGPNPNVVIAGTAHTPLRGIPVAGGYRVSGRVPFVSNCHNAAWLAVNAQIVEAPHPPQGSTGPPAAVRVLIPMAACEILDTWDVLGMRGTGSHDVAVTEVFVPEIYTYPNTAEVVLGSHYQGALYRFPILGIQAMLFPPVALAVARCAMDAVTALAHGKTPFGSTTMLQEQASTHAQLARAEALWRAGRVLLYESLRVAWDVRAAGETLTLQQRADLLLAMTQAVSGAATAVEWMWGVAGTSGIFRTSPLERHFRDMQVLRQHAFSAEKRYETVGRVFLGLPPQYGPLERN